MSNERTGGRTRANAPARTQWLGYLLAAACLAWVLHDIHPERAFRDLPSLRWGWVAAGVGCDLLSYVAQGLRWKLLLLPVGRVRVSQCVRAIYAGLFVNEVLPLRAGELLRAHLVARDAGLPFPVVLTLVGVERLLDGVLMALAIGVVSLHVPLPGSMKRAAEAFGLVILLLLLGFIVLLCVLERRHLARMRSGQPSGQTETRLGRVLEGLRVQAKAPSFYVAAVASSLIPAGQILALWAMTNAFGFGLTLWAAAAVLIIINLGVAVPNAPANAGSYQFFCVFGLTLLGVEKSRAAGFSIAGYLLLTLPFLLLGFLALVRSGLNVSGLSGQVRRLADQAVERSGS
ncbi:MAG: flippase-like domain-containing protein [Acidobacteria bacterium]|nr:flippase-like domain-containing protein [Acidobacteriota bacterium]MBI3664004.1 flippase-like domain-containing protein [Acidobacteriota bacterium]